LRHKNIVSLLGIVEDTLQLISEWMPGGNLMDYVEKYPDANKHGLVGVPLQVFDTLTPTTSYVISPKALNFSTLTT
jgi:hypothetical protein